jgi:CRISPR-associated endonuclease/helicase Cas3
MLKPRSKKSSQAAAAEALPLTQCYAKTVQTPSGLTEFGRTVFDHCLIVGGVAEEIAKCFPEPIREKWFPRGVGLVAACHDVGKVSPTFQKKIYTAVIEASGALPKALEGIDPSVEKGWGHAGVSELAAQAWNTGRFIPEILGCHHGKRPRITLMRPDGEVVGGKPWEARRQELAESLRKAMHEDWPRIEDLLSAKVTAGLTSVADWIGSGPQLESGEEPPSEEKLRQVTRLAGYTKPSIVQGLGFRDIFGFFPTETQAEIFKHINGPGTYVLEAPMGIGKTEAALYLAYCLISSGRATGLYFALPTQTTSECIWSRVNRFLEKILPGDSPFKQALLVHGNAWLKQSAMGGEGSAGRSWFSYGKRGILAPFGVGTVDQALMAVMNVRYGAVRTFGLLGKAVILDEVHSYDVYTGTILDELVRTLEKLGCTVIVLSATLTKERREALLERKTASSAYPLLSIAAGSEGLAEEIALPAPLEKTVSIARSNDGEAVLQEALRHARSGEQVLWIENTVGEAQAMFRRLKELSEDGTPIEIGLVHSRFTKSDRAQREDHWVGILGKHGSQERAKRGRFLVGTQVLEQSLDIDADLLVTRICPTDMLLQRIGRLWRHEKTSRPAGASCKAWVLAPELADAQEDPSEAFGPTASVYAPYVLCRTLEVWADRESLVLPADIRPLLEATYAARSESGEFSALRSAMENGDTVGGHRRLGTRALRQLALSGLSTFAPESDDENPPTRYSEMPTSDVLILKNITEDDQGTHVTLWDGTRLVLPAQRGPEAAVALMQNCVTVPRFSAPAADDLPRLSWLRGSLYVSESEGARIRVAVAPNETGNLLGLRHEKLDAMYSSDFGYLSLQGKDKAGGE